MPAKCAAPRATAHLSQEYRTPAWEQRKLGQHLKLSRELGHTGVDARKLTVKLWGKGVVEKTDLYGGSAQTQYYIRHAGQFMYGKLDFLHAAFGVVPDKLDCFESTLDSPAFDIEGLDSSFLLNLVTQEDFYLKNGNIANGSRKAKRIHEETFLNMEIRAPELVEQRRIGAFLDRLDSLITLHQRKYDKLCVLKKSMLDKMFPKGGSLYPEIRFAGFTDPWEQRKLGELFEEHSEKDRDDLPALTIIQGGGTVHRDESNRNLQFDRNSLSNYKVVDTGDFIVHLRSFEGGLEKATCCGLVSPAYHIFRGKNVDSDFYYLYFRSKRFIDADLKPHVYGIRDGRSIDIEGMKTIFIPWTNLAEQRRIGAFFDRLDSLITLHQRKYDGCANPLFSERRISCRKPSHQNRCSATTTPSG